MSEYQDFMWILIIICEHCSIPSNLCHTKRQAGKIILPVASSCINWKISQWLWQWLSDGQWHANAADAANDALTLVVSTLDKHVFRTFHLPEHRVDQVRHCRFVRHSKSDIWCTTGWDFKYMQAGRSHRCICSCCFKFQESFKFQVVFSEFFVWFFLWPDVLQLQLAGPAFVDRTLDNQ